MGLAGEGMMHRLLALLILLCPAIAAGQSTSTTYTPQGDTIVTTVYARAKPPVVKVEPPEVVVDSVHTVVRRAKPDTVKLRDTLWLPAPAPKPEPVIAPAPVPAPVVVPAPSLGVATGLFSVEPADMPSRPFSGGLIPLYHARADSVASRLGKAKAAGYRVWVAWVGGRANYVDANGFRLDLWKGMVNRLNQPAIQAVLKAYADSGTILGHYLLDEPNYTSAFNGRPPTTAELQDMACYSKQLYPYLPTTFRVVPQWLAGKSKTWSCLDAAWAQWEGTIHVPSDWTRSKVPAVRPADTTLAARLKAEDSTLALRARVFADSNRKAALAIGLNIVLGFNTLDGGDGPASLLGARFAGTYGVDPNHADNIWKNSSGGAYRYQMSGAELERVGLEFVKVGCAVISWISSSSSHATMVQTMSARLDVQSAYTKILTAAKAQPQRSCGKP